MAGFCSGERVSDQPVYPYSNYDVGVARKGLHEWLIIVSVWVFNVKVREPSRNSGVGIRSQVPCMNPSHARDQLFESETRETEFSSFPLA